MPGDKSVKECVSLGKHGLKSRCKQCQNKVFDKDILWNGLTYKTFMPTVRLYPTYFYTHIQIDVFYIILLQLYQDANVRIIGRCIPWNGIETAQ